MVHHVASLFLIMSFFSDNKVLGDIVFTIAIIGSVFIFCRIQLHSMAEREKPVGFADNGDCIYQQGSFFYHHMGNTYMPQSGNSFKRQFPSSQIE